MKTAGIIAEYNPFHKGHEYHIKKTKEVTGADYCVVIMSGNYVQRGTPAILDKYTRTRMALDCGADLVIELPIPFATASANIFAQAGVTLLDRLGCINHLCFGSESASISLLSKIASVLSDDPEDYRSYLQAALKSGKSYPRSVYEAVTHYLLTNLSDSSSMLLEINRISAQLASPNNILGIEYLKALRQSSSAIAPVAIQRKGDSYHAQELSDELASATAIRNWSERTTDIYGIRPYVPEQVFSVLKEQFHKSFPITEDDMSSLLNYVLVTSSDFSHAAEMTAELADRIRNTATRPYYFRELADALKCKNITRARINRALLHGILNITMEDMTAYHSADYCCYARILGFRESAGELLHQIRKQTRVPLLSKIADAGSILDETGMRILNQEIAASRLYNLTVYQKFGTLLPDDYRAGVIVKKDSSCGDTV